MKKKRKTGRKLLSFLLTLAMVVVLMPGMSMTTYAADEVSENISLVASVSSNLKTISGTHYSVSCGYSVASESGMQVNDSGALTINARKGETITKVVLTYNWGTNKSSLSASPGTFDGDATISDINARQVTISSSHTAGVKISAVTVYFEGSLSNPTVTLTGGANAKSSGGLLTQRYLPGAMDTVTYTALTGAAFPAFENFTQNGVTVERTSDTVVTVSGTPTANTAITVPDAVSSSKIVTWGSSIINDSGRNGLEYQIDRNSSYSDTANGITLTKSGSGFASLYSGYWMLSGDVTLIFTTATGKFTNIEIETSRISDGGNWTKDGNTLKWNGTPSNSVSLSGSSLNLEGVSSINFVIEMPTVTVIAGDNMTKTETSGAASQTGLTGAMTDAVYTADNGYYFPTDYSVAAVNGISVTRNSYTQITVSGTPTADASITLTAPTAKTKPDAPTTAAAVDCTTADNNDGKLTGVTADMEYKKSDAESWTVGTGSDITGLVPGTYYVRVKATDTSLASDNQQLTIKAFGQKETATVTKAPTAKTLTYNGSAQELVNAGEATGGVMQYALGTDDKTAPITGWSDKVPTATDAGTYYVWYTLAATDGMKLVSDCITVTIKSASASNIDVNTVVDNSRGIQTSVGDGNAEVEASSNAAIESLYNAELAKAKSESGDQNATIDMSRKVTPKESQKSVSGNGMLNNTIRRKINEIYKAPATGNLISNLFTQVLDLSYTKTITSNGNKGNPQAVSINGDRGVIEFPFIFDMTNKYAPVIFRQHGTEEPVEIVEDTTRSGRNNTFFMETQGGNAAQTIFHLFSDKYSDFTIVYSNNATQQKTITQTAGPAGGGSYYGGGSSAPAAASSASAAPVIETIKVFRLFKPVTGEHFFTRNEEEAKLQIEAEYNDEGIAWSVPSQSSTPVYRVFDAFRTGDHYYTTDAAVRDKFVKEGWVDEKIGWYSDDSKTRPVYRFINPAAKTGKYMYTASEDERQALIAAGWVEDGIAFYAK